MQYSYDSNHLHLSELRDNIPSSARSTDSNLFRPTSYGKWSTSALIEHEEEMRNHMKQMGFNDPLHDFAESESDEESSSAFEGYEHHPHMTKKLSEVNMKDADDSTEELKGPARNSHDDVGSHDTDASKHSHVSDGKDTEEPPDELPMIKNARGDWRVGDMCVLQRMPKKEYENQQGRLLEFLPQKRKWRVLLVTGKQKVVVIVPKSNLKKQDLVSLSRSVQSSVTVTPRGSTAHPSMVVNPVQPPDVSDTEFTQLLSLLQELKHDVARMKQTSTKEKRAAKSEKRKAKRSPKEKRYRDRDREKRSRRRERRRHDEHERHRSKSKSRSRHRKKPRKKRRIPEEPHPFYGGGVLPSYNAPPQIPPHMAAPPIPMYGPQGYPDPYGYSSGMPMVDPYSFPPQPMQMQYQHHPPPQMPYGAPSMSPYHGPPPTDPNLSGPMSAYGPPPGPDPNMYAPQFRPPAPHMHPGPMINRQPPPQHQPQPFLNIPRHSAQPQYDSEAPPRRGHSEMRHQKPKKVRHKRSATAVDNLDLNKSFRGRSHDAPRRKSKSPDYYETLKGSKKDDVPATRTKPSQNANALRFNDNASRDTIRRKVEFEEQTQARYFYMDDMPPQQQHGPNDGGHHVVQSEMQRLMQETKLGDFAGTHHVTREASGGLSHSIPSNHHSNQQQPPPQNYQPPRVVSHHNSNPTHIVREPSNHIHREPSNHIHREPSNHIHREPSNHIHREPSNPHQIQQDPSMEFDARKAADGHFSTARASKRYFVEDDYFIDRTATIEAEKYRVQGSDAPAITDQRLVNRYPSYASSNPYIGTLPEDNFKQPRRGAEELSA